MCGIVGYIGHREAIPVLITGLEHLEYRGYDSAGIACLSGRGSRFFVFKDRGKISDLKARLNGRIRLPVSPQLQRGEPAKQAANFCLGIGHTRWATHGAPSKVNAHPHLGNKGRIALVHNGIIENYGEIRVELEKKGIRFKSETDTEAAAQLIEYYYRGDLAEAVRKAARRLKGYFAFAAIAKDEPDRICALKRSNPLVIGVGSGEHFLASDVSALLPYTKKVIYVDDDELVELMRASVRISGFATGKLVKKKIAQIPWTSEEARKDGFAHYMLKEMYEQPRVVGNILKAYLKDGEIHFDSIRGSFARKLRRIQKIHFVSCGTAYHAGLVGNYMMDESVDIPCEATVSSEFRYEEGGVGKSDLVVLITQSGETADTLAALRRAKTQGALALAIVNVVGSTIAREADGVIYTHAGPEIGVASTKAYVAQLSVIALFSLFLARIHEKGKLKAQRIRRLLSELRKLPDQLKQALRQDSIIQRCAKEFYKKTNFLYLGRGYNFPNALEGALKFKEITYTHAHGYPAGEMKHGPIALIDSAQPVICICPRRSKTYEKMLSNIEEVKARGGILITIATKHDPVVKKHSRYAFFVPETEEMFSPIVTVIPLQLLAYHVAAQKGCDIDQPRNLAKSVTVE